MSQISIKAGQILHAMNQFLVDRIQTAGGALNIPTEKIYELGNYKSVAVVRDIPDLTFSLDCLDVDTGVEAILTGYAGAGQEGSADAEGTVYSLPLAKPMDVISPMKSAQGAFDTVRGVAMPHLTLESASYRYGLRENAGESFSLRGDSIFYVPGTPYNETSVATAAQTVFPFAQAPALLYTEGGIDRYALNVSVDGVRQVEGVDYVSTAAGITFTTAPATGAVVRLTYGSAAAATYNQNVHAPLPVKPAAIKGKDIEVYVGGVRWSDVQSVTVDYRVTIEDDYEFGNARAVARDFADAPAVTGSIEVKPLSPQALFAKLHQITGRPVGEIMGAQHSIALPVEVVLRNPDSGGIPEFEDDGVTPNPNHRTVMKTLFVSDARFTLPGYEGRVQQKSVSTLAFESDEGNLDVIKGARVP